MDNKKAIDLLNMIEFENAECNLGTWYHGIDGDMKEALEMAIKALKLTQIGLLKDCESCRAELSCTDTVGRQAVKEQMIKYGFHAPDMTVTEFVEGLPSVITEKTRWIPVSVIEDINADIKSEYVSLRHRTDEDIELGECIGLKIALGIIDSHTIAKMVYSQEREKKE